MPSFTPPEGVDLTDYAEALLERYANAAIRKDADGSFEEAAHLTGDTDMVELVSVLLQEEDRRIGAGEKTWEIPFRPDHGHELLDDASRNTHPGNPLIGRMRGLAELRGIIADLSHSKATIA